MIVPRTIYLNLIKERFATVPVCAILGSRQVGKTTIAHELAQELYPGQPEKVTFFDLENPQDLELLENPMHTLSAYNDHFVVIDEIQRRPELFPILRVLVDHREKKYKFLILGSASPALLRQSSESLAGRISYIELPPFTLFDILPTISNEKIYSINQKNEAYNDALNLLLTRGGFPRSYLAQSEQISFQWRKDYINTFLERDLQVFDLDISPQLMYKFWMMLCFYHGQYFNASELATSLMLSKPKVMKYLDILEGTFMIRILQPWYENIKKRQVRTPKIYFRDPGIFNALSSIHSLQQLISNPKIGPLWEGFALEQVISCLQIPSQECYFWSTSNEAELDLFVFKGTKRFGFEFKYAEKPKITKSMLIAIEDLNLDHLYVIFLGNSIIPLHKKITAVGLIALHEIKI